VYKLPDGSTATTTKCVPIKFWLYFALGRSLYTHDQRSQFGDGFRLKLRRDTYLNSWTSSQFPERLVFAPFTATVSWSATYLSCRKSASAIVPSFTP
jgi:hypothetical protein